MRLDVVISLYTAKCCVITIKLSSIEDRGQTDRVRVGVRVDLDL